ncbi:probable ligand-gated ion channel 46 [Hyalella azteca]|uniref:Probable ligand-gated ion channel 46 n=1 Tax=Hyalella azteca TaxID=294128 RepID=A0A8B7P3I9_HYAAZ|nr:probable ligand-gated ion channel 46 [Hyalella azteca]
MELAYYPFENYRCLLMFHSLGYDTEELRPSWADEPAVHFTDTQVSLPCEIDDVVIEHNTFVTTNRARRRLEAEIEMECYSGWTIKHTVVPFMLTVTLAYLAFFLHPRAVTARLMVSFLSFVIAMMVHEKTYSQVPQYPYTMAIEVFTGTCLGFIFCTVVETLVVDVICRSNDKLTAASYAREDCELKKGPKNWKSHWKSQQDWKSHRTGSLNGTESLNRTGSLNESLNRTKSLNESLNRTGSLTGSINRTGSLNKTGSLTGSINRTGSLTGSLNRTGSLYRTGSLTGSLKRTGSLNRTGSPNRNGSLNRVGSLNRTENLNVLGSLSRAGNLNWTGKIFTSRSAV